MPTNVLSSFLEERPRATYESFIADMMAPRRRFFANRYGDIYNQYQGYLATQARQGIQPRARFRDFLSDINWDNEYYSYSPYQRGFRPGSFAPPVRRLNY